MEILNKIQRELKAPKNQFNKFGNYSYRSCEDILEAVKPLLGDAILTISDDIVEVGSRIYVKSTVTLKQGDAIETNTAFAREEETVKGMSSSQITGSASSYARKYALNGLFLIDDTKDADARDNSEKAKKVVTMATDEQFKELDSLGVDYTNLCKALKIEHPNDMTFEMAKQAIAKKKASMEAK